MKLFTLAVGLFFFSVVMAQEKLAGILPLENGIVTYAGIVTADSSSKAVLYSNAKKWFAHSYKSASNVIQLDDKEGGEIIGKGNFPVNYFSRQPAISHTISIKVKDGRYKYIITTLTYSDNQNEKFPIEQFPNGWFAKKKLYQSIDDEIKNIIASLQKGMLLVEKDDW